LRDGRSPDTGLRRCAILAGLALLWLLAPIAAAGDRVVLTSGKVYENCEAERRPDGSVLVHQRGETVALDADVVARIEPDEWARKRYATRRAALRADDADGHFRLAQFCKAHGLWLKYRQELEQTLRADPNHKAAHLALGHRLVGGQWLSGAELLRFEQQQETMARKGLVYWKGKWVPREQAEAEKEAQAAAERFKLAVEQKRIEQGLRLVGNRWVPAHGEQEGNNLLKGLVYYSARWCTLEECLQQHAKLCGLVLTPYGWVEREVHKHMNLITAGGTIENGHVIPLEKLLGRLRLREGRSLYLRRWLTPAEQSACAALQKAARPWRSRVALALLLCAGCIGLVLSLTLLLRASGGGPRVLRLRRAEQELRRRRRTLGRVNWRVVAVAGWWLCLARVPDRRRTPHRPRQAPGR